MFWTAPGTDDSLHGIVMGFFRGEYHLFTTKGIQTPDGTKCRTVHHAVSKDLLSWNDLPDALGPGVPGAFDGYTLYDLHVIESNDKYYMFYTGLDIKGPGQQQAIGVAVSDDLITWVRHPRNPILTADPRWYERAIPDEATYQRKDNKRLWFRDPWVIRDPATGRFGMAVGARAQDAHPDLRGCIAWATSNDLINWTSSPPICSPQRFHTMECPVLFEHNGFHYLVYLTHPHWGTPHLTTDPHQRGGGFYAVSRSGINGPYETPEDEILVGGSWMGSPSDGRETMRAMVIRTVTGADKVIYAHYHLYVTPAQDDNTANTPYAQMLQTKQVMPIPKPLAFKPDGQMFLTYNPVLDRLTRPIAPPCHSLPPSSDWKYDNGRYACKNYTGRSVLLFDTPFENGVYEVKVRILRGLRAGLVLRASSETGPGWQIILDRQWECLTFGLLDTAQPVDRRRWRAHTGWAKIRVVVLGPSVEIYCDDALMLHQVRYREYSGKLGLIVENAEALFEGINIRVTKGPVPMPRIIPHNT
jgi:beta-fructofuranosidase